MERYWVWEYGLFEKNPKRVDSLNPETTLEVVKLADAQATVEAFKKDNRTYIDERHENMKQLEELRQQVEALQAQVKELEESRDAWKASQECSEKAYMALVNQIPAERFDYDPVNVALLDGAKEQEIIGRKQIADLQAALDAEREKVKGLHEITKVICTHCCEPMEIPSKAALQTQLTQLQDWRDQVTLALQRAGGARFEDVPGHVKTVVDDLTQLQALVRAKEDAYEKILLSRERLEREMRGYPPVDNEGIPMVWQEPVGWVKRHPGRHDASNY